MDIGEKGDSVKTYCNHCGRIINHQIIEIVKEHKRDLHSRDFTLSGVVEYYTESKDWYQIIKCAGCDTYSFREINWFSEWEDPFSNDPGLRESLFPQTTEYTRTKKKIINIPRNIEIIYEQVIESYNLGLLILSIAGIRAIIEGVCKLKEKDEVVNEGKETGKKRKDLFLRINELVNEKIISESQKNALHEIRFMGNSALHELEIKDHNEVTKGIEIVENMLVTIFEIPKIAEDLETSRKKKE